MNSIKPTINSYCKHFRETRLKLTLQEMEKLTGVNLKTISAFENGRSTNIKHLLIYVSTITTVEQERDFYTGLFQVMRGYKNE